ncbi:hypothetical protein NKF26_15780 [Haladaptatus sp. AB618]|uniref:hypothetical protein n=1 Tax=Haladaptatus sp. AB618 TaxID=2934173 RepID=UPI00209BFFA0|nr:hypothetical protein [Haladaptatus sp. AB618]MCO8255266.1 hypothetical protein [Haladaptatus sp. AB618]
MRFDSFLIQALATLMLVAGLVLAGYALIQPPQSSTTYSLSIQQADKNDPGVRSSSVRYGDLSDEARIAFGHAKLHGSYHMSSKPPDSLRSHSYVIDHESVYSLTISETEHITERMANLFGGTMSAVIGAFIFVSWLDVLSGFRTNE